MAPGRHYDFGQGRKNPFITKKDILNHSQNDVIFQKAASTISRILLAFFAPLPLG